MERGRMIIRETEVRDMEKTRIKGRRWRVTGGVRKGSK